MEVELWLSLNTPAAFAWVYPGILIAQIGCYVLAAGSVSLFYRAARRLEIGAPIDPRPRAPHLLRSEINGSLSSCTIIAVSITFSLTQVDRLMPASAVQAITHIVLFLVCYDFYMYVTHRALHSQLLRRFHARHHRSVQASPWACICLHPVEAAINYLPFAVFAALTPVSLGVLLGIHLYLLFGIANGHSNYNLLPGTRRAAWLLELSTFHQAHHTNGRGNYGYLFTHWDVLFGTRHPSLMSHTSLKTQSFMAK